MQDAVYGEGNDETVKPKAAASRKRKTPEEEQAIKEEAAAIDYKVFHIVCLMLLINRTDRYALHYIAIRVQVTSDEPAVAANEWYGQICIA